MEEDDGRRARSGLALWGSAVAAVLVFIALGFGLYVFWQLPAPLPSDASHLDLATQPGIALPVFGCAAGLVPPVRLEREGEAVLFVNVESGRVRELVWPSGYSAWLRNGQAQLVNHDGAIIAQEGDVIVNLGAVGRDLCLDFGWSPQIQR
jgi:hypothetical protein